MTFDDAITKLYGHKKLRARRASWSPGMRLRFRGDYLVITFIDGKTGLWVSRPEDKEADDWEVS